ncbi:MAG: GNAT family N-acetyltransferase [Mobilitalea sp.]
MLRETEFEEIYDKLQNYKYTSLQYTDYEDCQDAIILCNNDELILLQDKTKEPAMIYFAVTDFTLLIDKLNGISGSLRLHFVPREFAADLVKLGFIEWAEFADYFNFNLTDTASICKNTENPEFLTQDECKEASLVSKKCALQSRGFEGETEEWFADWICENKVLIYRENNSIAGFCCVSIYNEGTTLWVREVAVDPAYQGTGIGKKLMEQAIIYGVTNGAVKGFLMADVLNKNAIGLYEKYGFTGKDAAGELQMIRR